jgi:hypothetical protein
MDISLPYPPYIVRRSCFVKCFPKTISDSPLNLLHEIATAVGTLILHRCMRQRTPQSLATTAPSV